MLVQLKPLRWAWALIACVVLCVLMSRTAPVRAAGSADLLDDLEDDDHFGDDDVAAGGYNANSGGASESAPAAAKPVAAAAADDADEDKDSYYDSDEFEGLDAPKAAAGSSGKKKAAATSAAASGADADGEGAKKPTRITEVKVAPASGFGAGATGVIAQSWVVEIAGVCFIVAYAVNFFVGKRANEKIAQKWFADFQELFGQQFAVLGSYEGAAQGSAGGLLKESQSVFKFFASGRRHCQGMLVTLELKKRHDLFSMALAMVDLSTTRDTATVELQMDEGAMEPFVFAIVRRKEVSRTKKNNRDLENFGSKIESSSLPASLAILTDCAELEQTLLDDRVLAVLRNTEPWLSSLHFTDQNVVSSTFDARCVLRFRFNLAGSEQLAPGAQAQSPPTPAAAADALQSLMRMAIHFVDRVAQHELSATAKGKAAAKRKKLAELASRETNKQRQEALARRKEELKKKEDEAAAATMTPEQLRKKEERDYKKSLKNKLPRVKMIR